MTEQDLQTIRAILKEELAPITERLDRMEEGQEEVRTGVNALLEWSDKVSDALRFPLPRL